MKSSTGPWSLSELLQQSTPDYLRALDVVDQVYKSLPGSTLDIMVLDKPIRTTQWAGTFLQQEETKYSREIALSCITYHENSKSDVSPDQLRDVFAMSCGDSIYIADQFLCDPWEVSPAHKFKRVLGNFGRSGITMLIPPLNPMIRAVDPGAWKVINNHAFNNLEEDHFEKTSLHLSFTDYYRPIDLSHRGEQDVRVAILESVISIHDAGIWVADVDVLRAIQSPRLKRLSRKYVKTCNCSGTHIEDTASLENWDEILELPVGRSVVRAKGKPLARLATTAVLTQIHAQGGKKPVQKICICLPEQKMCIHCFLKERTTENLILVY